MKLWQPFTQHAIAPPPPVIARAGGAHLYTSDGAKVFDAISSWWVTTHGHGEPTIRAAIAAQMEKLSQIILANFTHDAANEFIAGLAQVTAPEFMHVFLSDSGSTAVEVAIKMAVGAWYHRGAPQRHKIIAFDHAYHGDTIGTSSVGARGAFTRTSEPLLFEVLRVPSPADGAVRCLEVLEQTLRAHAGEVAAVLIEPLVQGAGGMKMYSPAVLDDITCLARAHGAFVIFDEVMTGFGRTGTLFAYEQCRERPDIITLAKGITGGFLPMAATLATQEIFDAFYAPDRARMLFYSTSYTGNALACAAAVANLRVWQQPAARERLAALVAAQTAQLARIVLNKNITSARQCGTIAAFEIASNRNDYLNDISPRMQAFCLARGVLLRPLGNTVYIMPPYCTTAADLEHCYDIIAEFLEQPSLLRAA